MKIVVADEISERVGSDCFSQSFCESRTKTPKAQSQAASRCSCLGSTIAMTGFFGNDSRKAARISSRALNQRNNYVLNVAEKIFDASYDVWAIEKES